MHNICFRNLSLSLSFQRKRPCIFFLIRFSLKIRASICPFTSNKVIYFNRPLIIVFIVPRKCLTPKKEQIRHLTFITINLPVSLSLFCFSNSVFLIIFPLLTSGHCSSLSQPTTYYRDNSKGEERERTKMDLSGHQGEIPIPMTTTYIPSAHTSHTHGHSLLHHTTSNNNITPTPANANNNGPANLATEDHHSPRRDAMPAATPLSIPKKNTITVKYKECLKNHAASIGGNATDGCGEFMPSGPDGTIEALKCSACGCHRNFHRKEVEGDPYASCHCKGPPYIYSPAGRSSISVRPALPALTHHPHHQMVCQKLFSCILPDQKS